MSNRRHLTLTKHDNQGCWSRRIDETNRLMYYIEDDKIIILQCRTHYKDK
ncbi:MAG: type II toxin-antitoxin system YoeB family toxin [Desulfosporosinus sp.]|nr:type II toxin-antitoxin system YoeB family toxin [Desulfosporosinus sp.]